MLKTSWGVVVWITCEATFCDAKFCDANADTSQYVSINDGLQLEIRERLSEEEKDYLCLGVGLVAGQIKAAAANKCVLIRVLRVDIVLTDYQPEGLACAIMGWAGEYFGFKPPSIPISYDREQNRYDFSFN